MSIFASECVSDPIPVPFDKPHTIIVRKLNGREHNTAQAAHLAAFVAGRPVRGWAVAFRNVLQKGVKASDAETAHAVSDPLNGYDLHEVIRAGLVSWSYGEKTDARIEDLDEETLEFIASEILKRTKPALFDEAALKNA